MSQRVTDRLKICDVPAYIYSKTGVIRHKWTIYHWRTYGKRTYSNRLIRLKSEKICGQVFTRQSWVDAFLQELEL